MGIVETLQATEFLGREFATWLYWHSFEGNGRVALAGIEPFEIWFESPVELVNDYGEATSVVLKGGTPLESPEALKAFRENKKIQRARLRLTYRNQTYTFGFHAGRFLISGLRLPLPPETAPADYLVIRLQVLEEFERFWESLLHHFWSLRLDAKSWRAQRKQIAAWLNKAEDNG